MKTNQALITRQLWALGMVLKFRVAGTDGQNAIRDLFDCLGVTPQAPEVIEMRTREVLLIGSLARESASLDEMLEPGLRVTAESLGDQRVKINLNWDDSQGNVYERLQESLRKPDSALECVLTDEGGSLVVTPWEWRLQLPKGDGELTLSQDAVTSLGERVRTQENGHPQIKPLENEALIVYRNRLGIYAGEHPQRHTRQDVFASVGDFFLRLDPRTGKIEVFQRSARPT